MKNHDRGHEEGRQVREVCGGLEDDCVRDIDGACGAGGEEERVVEGGEFRVWAEEEAEGEGRLRADGVEGAESHVGRL